MTLNDLGITKAVEDSLKADDLSSFSLGRIMEEHRERYIVSTGEKEYEAEVTGNLRFSALSREDFPAVGDWVVMMVYEPDIAIIHRVLPRRTVLFRQAVGQKGEKQIISANVDVAFIMQSAGANFNINRLERYMAVCNTGGIEPVMVLSKTDLASEEEISEAIVSIQKRHPGLKYLLLSNLTKKGMQQTREYMEKGKTYCLIGSSGVGKSTLINNLLNREELKTGEISSSTGKGRHITSRRELIVLDSGAIIIDTPGMKELGMADDEEGIRNTFREIYDISLKCKFPDCTHNDEKGCAVREALNEGSIDPKFLENFRKMVREQERFTATEAEKRLKDRQFGKMVKRILEEKKKNKF
jgi:ribosome biogenesis GTPase